jgi:hypothetical protein
MLDATYSFVTASSYVGICDIWTVDLVELTSSVRLTRALPHSRFLRWAVSIWPLPLSAAPSGVQPWPRTLPGLIRQLDRTITTAGTCNRLVLDCVQLFPPASLALTTVTTVAADSLYLSSEWQIATHTPNYHYGFATQTRLQIAAPASTRDAARLDWTSSME